MMAETSSFDVSRDFTLVLTASINPQKNASTVRADPQLRQRDYQQALTYYLTHHPTVRRVVLIENTGWPLDDLRSSVDAIQHGKQLELVSLDCNDFPAHLGKGYGEFMLLDRGMEQSELIKQGTHFGKVTGRLRLLNLGRLLGRVKQPFDLLCDLHEHHFLPCLGIQRIAAMADTRFLAFSTRFYQQQVKDRYAMMDDSRGRYAELVLFDVAKAPGSDNVVMPRFPIEARWSGVSGGGMSYDSWRYRLKHAARSTVRRLFPKFWL